MIQKKQIATKNALTTAENKMPDISNSAAKALVNQVENRIPSISDLATNAALTTVEDKIPDISNLLKKMIVIQRLLVLKVM